MSLISGATMEDVLFADISSKYGDVYRGIMAY